MPRPHTDVVPHDTPDEEGMLLNPQDFLDRNHPANDQYMKSVEHVQRQIMHATATLRHKQVQILKTVFAGHNYTETALRHQTTPQTVSKLTNSEKGQRLLNLLQYHLTLLEGPTLAQRRNLLWRIAADNEKIDPKTTIQATVELNKMTFKDWEQNPKTGDQPQQTQIVINLNQDQLPRGALD